MPHRSSHARVLTRLRVQGPGSRADLVRDTGLSPTTMTRLVGEMLDLGMLEEQAPPPATGPRGVGRPQTPVGFRRRGRAVLGVHLHGDRTTAGLFDLRGEPITTTSVPHPDGLDAAGCLALGVGAARRLLRGRRRSDVLGIGVGIGGIVDPDRRVVLDWPMRGWADVDLGAAYDVLGLPVLVDGSARCLAAEEATRVAGRTRPTGLTLLVAGVVTAGMVMDRSLYRGTGVGAGNVQHLPVRGGVGAQCWCGAVDCLDTLASNRSLARLAQEQGHLPPEHPWRDVAFPGRVDNDGLRHLRHRRAEWLGEAAATLAGALGMPSVAVTGWLGSEDDVAHCLDVATSRLATTAPYLEAVVEHRTPSPDRWAEASAALVVCDFLRHPGRYEPSLA